MAEVPMYFFWDMEGEGKGEKEFFSHIFSTFRSKMGVSDEVSVFVINLPEKKKFIFTEELNADNLRAFIESVIKGTATFEELEIPPDLDNDFS